MLPLFFLILLTTCCADRVMSSIPHDGTLPELVQPPHELDVNETVDYNKSMTEAGNAFRKHLAEVLIPVDAQNLTLSSDLPSISNISLSDIQNDNSTQQQLLHLRNKNKLGAIRRIRDYIFQLTWYNRTLNGSKISERTPRDADEFFRSVPVGDKSIDDFIKALIRQASEATGQFTDGVVVYKTLDPSELKRQEVKFAELGLDDIIVAPVGVRWPVCNGVENVHPEILRKMINLQYPLPLRIRARTMMDEFQMEIHLREIPKCIPSGTKSISIIYYYKDQATKTRLNDFVPTGCSCRS